MNINQKAKALGFSGKNAIYNGKITKKYRKFIIEKEGKVPLPDDLIYNKNTKRIVKKDVYYTKKGTLRKKYEKIGYSKVKNVIDIVESDFPDWFYNPPIPPKQVKEFYVPPFSVDYDTDTFKLLVDMIREVEPMIKNKNISISLNYYDNDDQLIHFNSWSGIMKTSKIEPDMKNVIINNSGSEGLNFFFMCGNDGMINMDEPYPNNGGFITFTTFTPIKPVQTNQQYLEGLDYHCVLNPILDYYNGLVEKAKTKPTKKKYQQVINKLVGKKLKSGICKEGLLEKYNKGLYTSDIVDLVNTLPIDIKIYSPFVIYENKQKPLFEFKTKVKAYPDKVFTYINSRINHLDILVSNNNETIELEADEMMNLLNDISITTDFFKYKKNRDGIITIIYTKDKNYRLVNDSKAIVDEFVENNNLKNNKMYNTDPFHKFILNGVHYNGCIDINEIYDEKNYIGNEKYKKFEIKKGIGKSPLDEGVDELDYNSSSDDSSDDEDISIDDEMIIDDERPYKHIDMEKAYFNFNKNPLYDEKNAFLCRCSLYSNKIPHEYAINNVGYYKIKNINFSGCEDNIESILYTMSGDEEQMPYVENGIYPHIDLKFLDMIGVKFDIIEGVYGENMNINFGDDMKKKFKNGKENQKEGVPLYSSWVGLQNSISNKNRFYIKQDKQFLEALSSDIKNIGLESNIYINTQTNEAIVNYEKDVYTHRSHITGYITAYQRTATFLQLMKIKKQDIIRVVVDGIYYRGDTPELISSFREQNQKIKSNVSGDNYISNLEKDLEPLYSYNDVEFQPVKEAILFSGAGGTGKTTLNLSMGNKLKIGYLAHSNKLCRSMKKEYPDMFACPYHWIIQDNPKLLDLVMSCNFLLIDETSTLTSNMINRIKQRTKGIPKVFMGDITHQCLPISTDEYKIEDVYKCFDEVKELTYNYRFSKCKKQTETAQTIRDMMDKNLGISEIGKYCLKQYGKISEKQLLEDVKFEDILLSSRHETKDILNVKLSKILKPKYYVLKSKNEYSTGDILFEKPKDLTPSFYEIRYCYTIHSVQGETLRDNQKLYIDTKYLHDTRVLYTAISRAKYSHQIKFF